MPDNFFDFVGGTNGQWEITRMQTIIGKPLDTASHLNILPGSLTSTNSGLWTLKGFTSNVRYAEKEEKQKLTAIQAGLGRPEAAYAALIPIKKNEIWWELAQDERRKIFKSRSHHTEIGLRYLPAIARQLYHCRDIGQPFDFVTWFEYAPEHEEAFEELVLSLRNTEEWQHVEREIDIRLKKV